MPRKRQETPFEKIMLTRGKLRLYVEHGDTALDGQSPQEFAAEVQECYQYLMDFRNIVNSMVGLEFPPSDAAKMHVD